MWAVVFFRTLNILFPVFLLEISVEKLSQLSVFLFLFGAKISSFSHCVKDFLCSDTLDPAKLILSLCTSRYFSSFCFSMSSSDV